MSRKNVNFGDKKIKKSDFYKNKKVTKIDDTKANMILVYKEEPYDPKTHSNTLLDTMVMTSYVRKSKGNTTMSFKISDKELLEKYNQMWKRVEKLFKIEFDGEPVYGDKDKYIKTKIKKCPGTYDYKFSEQKNSKRKSPMQMFINNNARFCYQSKEKVLSSNTFRRMKILARKGKNGKSHWWWFRKKLVWWVW